MTEMQTAIGRVQLRKLPQWLTLRRRNAAVLTDGFSRIPGLRLTIPPQEIEHAYYKYYVFVEPEALEHPEEKQNSNGLFALFTGAFIGVLSGIFIGWIIWG